MAELFSDEWINALKDAWNDIYGNGGNNRKAQVQKGRFWLYDQKPLYGRTVYKKFCAHVQNKRRVIILKKFQTGSPV